MPAGSYSPLRRWVRNARADEFRRWLDSRPSRLREGILAAWFCRYWQVRDLQDLRDQTRPILPAANDPDHGEG